jgi:D-sedoheptulose 7-phosphate isomerase
LIATKLRFQKPENMNSINSCRSYFAALSATVNKLPHAVIENVVTSLVDAFESKRTVFLFGNGGSAALASHFACDLGKGTVNGSGKRFRVLALTDNVPVMTAWANDSNYEDIFAEQLINFVSPNDVAFAISASGNSPNVIKALDVARQAGASTIGLTGFAGGKMKALCDACIVIPCDNMQLIEDLHLSVAHALFTCVKHRISELPQRSWLAHV